MPRNAVRRPWRPCVAPAGGGSAGAAPGNPGENGPSPRSRFRFHCLKKKEIACIPRQLAVSVESCQRWSTRRSHGVSSPPRKLTNKPASIFVRARMRPPSASRRGAVATHRPARAHAPPLPPSRSVRGGHGPGGGGGLRPRCQCAAGGGVEWGARGARSTPARGTRRYAPRPSPRCQQGGRGGSRRARRPPPRRAWRAATPTPSPPRKHAQDLANMFGPSVGVSRRWCFAGLPCSRAGRHWLAAAAGWRLSPLDRR
jgi:hypothetical protein